jgi:hypothetical protein
VQLRRCDPQDGGPVASLPYHKRKIGRCATLIGHEEVVVPAGNRDDGFSGGLVEAVLGSSNVHGRAVLSLVNPVIYRIPEGSGRSLERREVSVRAFGGGV